jgi:hypothetical protein
MSSILLNVGGGGDGLMQVSLTVRVPEYDPLASGTEEVALVSALTAQKNTPIINDEVRRAALWLIPISLIPLLTNKLCL